MQESVSIELKNVSKHYGSTLVLSPFSLTLDAGCRTVLLGPSGCGKTTLLRMIAGLETPDEGSEIWIGGKNVTALPAEKRQIGFMFQSYALFPNMTVEENVAYGLTVRKENPEKIRETVKEMLQLVNPGALCGSIGFGAFWWSTSARGLSACVSDSSESTTA